MLALRKIHLFNMAQRPYLRIVLCLRYKLICSELILGILFSKTLLRGNFGHPGTETGREIDLPPPLLLTIKPNSESFCVFVYLCICCIVCGNLLAAAAVVDN